MSSAELVHLVSEATYAFEQYGDSGGFDRTLWFQGRINSASRMCARRLAVGDVETARHHALAAHAERIAMIAGRTDA